MLLVVGSELLVVLEVLVLLVVVVVVVVGLGLEARHRVAEDSPWQVAHAWLAVQPSGPSPEAISNEAFVILAVSSEPPIERETSSTRGP